MDKKSDWPSMWQELKQKLAAQPRCPEHPEYPCVFTLAQRSANDIVSIEADRIVVRSHRSMNKDTIEESLFRKWWEHMLDEDSASLVPGAFSNPPTKRSRIIGAILATCLPTRVSAENHNLITLK
jgi:hypothetical protein